jgi:hypothetical protein
MLHRKTVVLKKNKRAFIQESMVKMGLKGRNLKSISGMLDSLIQNNWNLTFE